MIHLVDLSDGVDSSHHIVLAVPIEPGVTEMWFMWSERKFLLVCCIIKASTEWLVTKNQVCRCHPQMRRDFYSKQLRQWRISLDIFCFAIFKGSIFPPGPDWGFLLSTFLSPHIQSPRMYLLLFPRIGATGFALGGVHVWGVYVLGGGSSENLDRLEPTFQLGRMEA